ncbi:ATP-binding cassette domain-containing protein [Phragmitibacter flavus]|uniref:ATP-binding cassette domain-containing protein n=1 Tax=Phragmitibacter flavus TaxID=2576071 RepID=A0A5R8KCR0_9BACT|nr:ATP-binding cassette domain-containing protein [Phragmitibacter flavus]TLD70088.1 ATP-binding cassette domain-containing protein [Phragmitibacter flavus]
MLLNEMSDVLRVSGLRYVRDDRAILDGIDWSVRAGEHWVVLGPNGCGKTSLINCLTGYEMATAGSIQVGEAQFGFADWREVRKHVGLVTSTLVSYLEPYEPVLDAVVSGREAILNLVGERDAALEVEARGLLERMGCGHLVGSRWGVLSQGERQKILICRAFMAEFEVLILDEPCAGLDPVAREHFLGWLGEMAEREGAPSLVIVTHHVEEILPCFSKVLLLKEGKVLAMGGKSEVLRDEWLGEAYGARVEVGVDEIAGRYGLRILEVLR